MRPHRHDVEGPALLVEGRVGDELIVERQPDRIDHGAGVISLNDAFGRVIEAAVAGKDAKTAIGEE